MILALLLCLLPLSLQANDLKDQLKQHIKETSESKEELFVFVSLSMPDETLVALSKEIEESHGIMVVRGVPNNSFKAFAKRILGLREKGFAASLQIHPKLFKEYGVGGVPAFVLKQGDTFDKVSGNIALKYALELFASDNDD